MLSSNCGRLFSINSSWVFTTGMNNKPKLSNTTTNTMIEAEAAPFAESHSRELVGMDRHKILQMVKERIAKEKGFTL